MKAYTKTIFEMFDGKRRYQVPLFQRQYVWSRYAQWEPLWDDIKNKINNRLNEYELIPHFMGAIVLDQIRTYGREVQTHLIIDGQQRLTTFQIFLAAFRDICNKFNNSFGSEIERYLINTGTMDKLHEEFKVWPTNYDQELFSSIIKSKSREVLEIDYPLKFYRRKPIYRPHLIETYLFFYDSIQNYLNEEDVFSNEEKIEALYEVLKFDLEIVSIELEGKDDPQVIFETLNARGEPLLPSDLLRNFIFWRASRKGEDCNFLYNTYWESLDSHFWKQPEKQGRLKRPRIDLFMQHFLQMKRIKEANIGKLYHEYKDWIEGENPYESTEAELKDLVIVSNIYKEFIDQQHDTDYSNFFKCLKVFDITTIYPLLLYILKYELENNEAQPEINGIMQDLESYIIRRAVCNFTTKNYNNIFMQLLREINTKGCNRKTLQASLLKLSGETAVWPDDQQFEKSWINNPIYAQTLSGRIDYILRGLEKELHNEKNENITIHSFLTIEHIMPRSWESKWPLDDGTVVEFMGEYDDEKKNKILIRDILSNSIGNLTLLTNSLNASISNNTYAVKKPEITKQSSLKLNSYFQDINEWNEMEITKRGMFLFEKAKKIWTYPKEIANA